jgi:hypothetical protein
MDYTSHIIGLVRNIQPRIIPSKFLMPKCWDYNKIDQHYCLMKKHGVKKPIYKEHSQRGIGILKRHQAAMYDCWFSPIQDLPS